MVLVGGLVLNQRAPLPCDDCAVASLHVDGFGCSVPLVCYEVQNDIMTERQLSLVRLFGGWSWLLLTRLVETVAAWVTVYVSFFQQKI